MLYLTKEFALPETKEEFSMVELEIGVHKRIDEFFLYGQTMKDNDADATISARKALAKKFTVWFIKHWRTVHRIGKIQVEKELYGPRTKYRIYFTDDSRSSLEIMLPEISNDIEERELAYRMDRIIRVITGKSKNNV